MEEPRFRKGNKEGRAAALKGAIEVLWDTPGMRLRSGNLSADLDSPENIDVSKLDVSASLSHAELDRILSLVEGTLAAYTVHRHWKGRDGSMVVGAGDEGSVLLPAPASLHERIAEECKAARVPYV
jgi:predicted RNase H-like nuclease